MVLSCAEVKTGIMSTMRRRVRTEIVAAITDQDLAGLTVQGQRFVGVKNAATHCAFLFTASGFSDKLVGFGAP